MTTVSAPTTRKSFVAAARALWAGSGPRGVSLREVAAASHRSHALVARHFGSKAGLIDAVVDSLAAELTEALDIGPRSGADPVAVLLERAHANRVSVQLLVRCGLGELPGGPLAADDGPLRRLVEALGATPTSATRRRPQRPDLCAYAAASLVLGWLTFDGFISEAARLTPISPTRRDDAIAMAARAVAAMATADHPELRLRLQAEDAVTRQSRATTPEPVRPIDPRTALIDSAIELFAVRGPAAVTTREIARHAHVNLGLQHRHFGSKAALIAEAIEQGSMPLFPAALADTGFDLDTVVRQVRRESMAPLLIARILVDDFEITAVREQFPIVRRLVDAYPTVPTGAGSGGLDDPRLAVAAVVALVLGSAIWDTPLRAVTGIDRRVDLDQAVSDIARALLDAPHPDQPVVGLPR